MKPKRSLPKKALENHIAILGKTGSGKTSIAKAEVIEPGLDAGERVCTIDPTGAHWGLRLKADGKSKGYPIHIFGGRHADRPLLATHGELLAEFIGKTATPCILDTSLMRNSERTRFFTDFADGILRYNESLLRLVIDEAHVFMPQAGTRGAGALPDMLHAGNNLISLGRSRGIRCVLISQRAAKLHKDSLTQVETLIAARLIAPQDRAAVRAWIADQADLERGNEIIASLPKLAAGEAWAWSPESDFLKRIQFRMPQTFDSSSGIIGKKSKKLPLLDIKVLDARFEKLNKETKDQDPKELRARIAQLEAEARKKTTPAAAPAAAPAAPKKAELKNEFNRGVLAAKEAAEKYGREVLAAAEKALQSIAKATTAISSEATRAASDLKKAKLDLKKLPESRSGSSSSASSYSDLKSGTPSSRDNAPAKAGRIAAQAQRESAPNRTPEDGGSISEIPAPWQSILDAIAWWNALGIDHPTREQVAFKANYRAGTSTFDTYIGKIKSAGLILSPATGKLCHTPAGAEVALRPAVEPSGSIFREEVLRNIPQPWQKILTPLLESYPDSMTRTATAEAAGYPLGSTFDTYIGKMKAPNLINSPAKGELKASDWLFPNT